MEKFHEEEYLRLCAKYGWRNQLPNVKAEEKAAAEAIRATATAVHVFSAEAVIVQIVRFVVSTDQVDISLNYSIYTTNLN